MTLQAPPAPHPPPPPAGPDERREWITGITGDALAVAGALITLYAVVGAPQLGVLAPNTPSRAVRGLLVAALGAVLLVVVFGTAGPGRRRALARTTLIALGALSAIALAGDPRYAAILVLLLVGLEAARGGAIGPRAREQAAGAFLLGIGTVLLEVPGSTTAHELGALGIVFGLVAIAGLFPTVRQLTVRAPAAEGDVGWLALVSPVLVLVVVTQELGRLRGTSLLVFDALAIAFGVLNLAWGTLGAWRATDDLVGWRFLFFADWGLALIGLGSHVADHSGIQGGYLILFQILLVRYPLHELAQVRVAAARPRRARALSIAAGAVLCGLPPFVGFAARFYLLRASIELGPLLTATVAVGLLLWALLALRMGRGLGHPRGRAAIGTGLVLAVALVLGVVPWLLLETVGLT